MIERFQKIGWRFLRAYTCVPSILAPICLDAENQGWRYLMYTVGALTLVLWAIRLFTIPLYESPRFLIGKGKDEEAVAVVHKIAKLNKRPCSLTVEELIQHGRTTNTSESRFGGCESLIIYGFEHMIQQ